MREKGGMGWDGEKSSPPSKIYYICCMCYIAFATFVGKGGRGWGTVGWTQIQPTIKIVLYLLYLLY